jgi:DNA-binding LacI/PurR family transcriptional regulator
VCARGVNIAAVAAEAGVGVGTVSRVINGSAKVSPETRARVLQVIEALGYRPSALASALASGAVRAVAVLVPYLTRPSTVARLDGAVAVLEAEGYDAIVCNIKTPAQRDRALAAFADTHRAAGVLVVSIPLSAEQIGSITSAGLPVVSVDADNPGCPSLVIDNHLGGRLATEHLLGLGHRRIGFIGDAPDAQMGFRSTSRRLAGFRAALRRTPGSAGIVVTVPHGATEAAAAAVEMLGGRDPPTAIFAASDTQAIGVLHAAEKLALSVPEDLSVVGFDDIDTAGLLGLTTVRQPLERSGEQGAVHLCRRLAGGPPGPARQVLPLEMVVRSSTAPPRRSVPPPGRSRSSC